MVNNAINIVQNGQEWHQHGLGIALHSTASRVESEKEGWKDERWNKCYKWSVLVSGVTKDWFSTERISTQTNKPVHTTNNACCTTATRSYGRTCMTRTRCYRSKLERYQLHSQLICNTLLDSSWLFYYYKVLLHWSNKTCEISIITV